MNSADLTNQEELDEFEFAMFQTRIEEPLPGGDLDYPHYRSIHHHLFQDVYAWAGQPRTIRIAKAGNWFCYPENLEHFMGAIFGWLDAKEFLFGLSDANFASNAAYFLSELNAGHPFREGNGRTQLTFFRLLVANAGRRLDDTILEPERTLAAMIASFSGNLVPLERLIRDIIA